MRYYSIPIRKTKSKGLTVPSIDKDVEKVGLMHFCWSINCYSYWGSQFGNMY